MASMPYFVNTEQRHYKKDTRFLLDLYTITYDNHESVDNICCLVSSFSYAQFFEEYLRTHTYYGVIINGTHLDLALNVNVTGVDRTASIFCLPLTLNSYLCSKVVRAILLPK